MSKKSTRPSRSPTPRRVRLTQGELIRCPLTGQLIPACCCPVKK